MNRQTFHPEWVEAARNGDQDAITALYNYSYQSVYLTIKSLVKGEEDTVLDLMQDSFVKAFSMLDKLGADEKFPAWIKVIGRNTALDWLRKTKPIVFSAMNRDEENPIELQWEDDDMSNLPEVVLDQQETSRLIREIMDSLSDGQRMALSMYYFEEMSIADIARITGNKEGTVKALLYQGRKKVEAKVRELEKQGTKLYSLAPMPFLLLLLRKTQAFDLQPTTERIAELTQRCAERGILSQTGTAAPSTAATASAGGNTSVGSTAAGNTASSGAAVKTASAAGTAARSAVKGKIIAGIVAAAIVGGGIGGGFVAANHYAKAEKENSNQIVETRPDEKESEEKKTTESENSSTQKAENELEAYHNALVALQEQDGAFLQYAHLADLNNDGTDEMYVLYDNTKVGLYEYKNGQAEEVAFTSWDNGTDVSLIFADTGAGWSGWVQDKTYQETMEDAEPEQASEQTIDVLIDISDDGTILRVRKDDSGVELGLNCTLIEADGDQWKTTEYTLERGENSNCYRDGTQIDLETYNQETLGNFNSAWSLTPSDDLAYLLGYDKKALAAGEESYTDLLQDMDEQGSFLQYAHLVDLNGDGSEELVLLYDNRYCGIYTAESGAVNQVAEITYSEGFLADNYEYVTDKTYEELENPNLAIQYGQSQNNGIYVRQGFTEATIVRYEDGEWTDNTYSESDGTYYLNGTEIDENTYYSAISAYEEGAVPENYDEEEWYGNDLPQLLDQKS